MPDPASSYGSPYPSAMAAGELGESYVPLSELEVAVELWRLSYGSKGLAPVFRPAF